MKIEINKEEFINYILEGKTIPELQEIYNCGRTVITSRKKEFGLVGLSPNGKKRDLTLGTKYCPNCGVEKSLEEFYSNGYTPKGNKKYKPTCKKCEQTSVNEKYYTTLKSILEEQGRSYKCELCGYAKNYAALCFHHHTGVKNFGIGDSSKTMQRVKLAEEIALCKVLCQNCHHEIHNPTLMIYIGDD